MKSKPKGEPVGKAKARVVVVGGPLRMAEMKESKLNVVAVAVALGGLGMVK